MQEFNKLASYRTNLDEPNLDACLKQGIAYPLDYRAPLAFKEIKKIAADQAQHQRNVEISNEMQNKGRPFTHMTQVELASNLIDPAKLSALENSYQVYQKFGQGTKPERVIKAH